MIRQCVKCQVIYGCVGHDGKKWKCTECPEVEYCATYLLQDPPHNDVTGGLCDDCMALYLLTRKA